MKYKNSTGKNWDRVRWFLAYGQSGLAYTNVSITASDTSAFILGAIACAYDALNRRTNMVDSVGTTSWRYDAMGRLVGESGPFGTPEVQVAYDPNGRLTNVTWGTFSVDYAFDDLGRIVAVAAPEGTYAFTYLSNGIRRATVAYPNGVTETRAHDELARCTSLAFLSGTNPLLSIAYAYDAGDRRTNEVWSTGRAMAYGYDDANQLTSVDATRPSDAARYRYDAAGNPVDRAELGLDVTNSFNNLNQIVTGSWTGSTVTVAGSVNYPAGSISVNNTPGTIYPDSSFDVAAVPVTPGTNTLVATYVGPAFTNVPMTATDTSTVVLGDTAYTHDANGNLTSDATFLYQYDLANQLTNVVRKADNSVILQCRYDALGRRVEAIRADGTVDRYVYFPGSFLVLAVLDGSNTPKELYTRGPDLSGTLASAGGISGILACTYSNAPTAPLYHHADLMGNVIATTDASSSIVSTFRYSPFGQLAEHLGSCFPRYRFSSKETDLETDLLYFGYRYLCPRPGQWMTRDPLSETEGENLYGYVGNNPFAVYDAQGLARVHFDEAGCKWQVKLHWKVEFLNAPYQVWSDSNKFFWKTETAKVVSNYFSTRNYRCFPCSEACSLCQTGVTVDFQLIYVESDAEADYFVTVVRNSMSDSKTTLENRTVQFNDLAFALGETANGYKQLAAIHETGHMLGLKHPGVAYGAKSNSYEDYAADAPSLMGFGMEMRVEDFDKAFCSHIKTDGEGCNPWHAK